MRAPILAPAGLLLAAGLATSAGAQTADRYGYAPPEAQTPMRPALAARATAAPTAAPPLRPIALQPGAAPPLRMLSWPGKGVSTTPPALRPAPGMASAQVAPAAASSPPVRIASVAPRPRPTPAPPRQAAPAAAPPRTAAAFAAVPADIAPPSRRTIAPAPTRATFASAPADPVQGYGAAGPPGPSALPPPNRPWYQRYPEAAVAQAPPPGSGVGASLTPGTPAAPPPAAPLGAYAAPAAGAAPVRSASLTPATGGARYYSVHKPYGYTPDPAPIPPQFFGPTADLSAPETAEPARATLTANAVSARAAVNAARLQQGATN